MNYLDAVHNILKHHPVTAFFNTNLVEYHRGSVTLELKARNEFIDMRRLRGSFGCIVDCLASIAGMESIGDCSVSEYELNFHPLFPSREFIANARIESSNLHYATYRCSIYSAEDQVDRLLAEAQGTLCQYQNYKNKHQNQDQLFQHQMSIHPI